VIVVVMAAATTVLTHTKLLHKTLSLPFHIYASHGRWQRADQWQSRAGEFHTSHPMRSHALFHRWPQGRLAVDWTLMQMEQRAYEGHSKSFANQYVLKIYTPIKRRFFLNTYEPKADMTSL